jgi:ribose 5-phosphate isomerase B
MDSSFDFSKPVAIGADHAGFQYKERIASFLKIKNISYKDYGTYSADSADYPDFAHPVSSAVENGEAACGILICGSGNGVAITANKHQGIRAALCWLVELARLARQHNNANVLCLPQRFVEADAALDMVDVFLSTAFEGGRHERRVEKIACAV